MKKRISCILVFVLMCCILTFTVSAEDNGLIQLPAPTDLEWGYDRENDRPLTGAISFKGVGSDCFAYDVNIYRNGEWYFSYYMYANRDNGPAWYTVDDLAYSDLESGTYHFTVTAYSRNGSYGESMAQSAQWQYVKPENSVDTCTAPSLDREHVYWTAPEDTSWVGGYEYEVLFSPEEDGAYSSFKGKRSDDVQAALAGMADWAGPGVGYYCSGFYCVRIRTLSSDLERACHGQWVQADELYYHGFDKNGIPLLDRCTITGVDKNKVTWQLPEDAVYVDGYELEIYYCHSASDERYQPVWVAARTGTERNSCYWEPDNCSGYEGFFYFRVKLKTSDPAKAADSLWTNLYGPFYYCKEYTDNDGKVLPFRAKEWEVVKIVNRERMAQGLNPLTMFDALQAVSDIRAEEIKEKFDHERPNGTRYYTLFNELGISWNNRGENIAVSQDTRKLPGSMCSPEEVMDLWMNSKDHKANIMKPEFAHIGVGLGEPDSRGDYWVQNFTDGSGYTSMAIQVKPGYTVAPGTTIEEMDLVAILQSKRHGSCYLPVAAEFCCGYDPDLLGVQAVTISALGVKTTFEVTVGKTAPTTMGDLNDDGAVDDNDVAQLLWHTLFPDAYEITGNADFNGDGTIDDADVAYLLWHTLFPNEYPLN